MISPESGDNLPDAPSGLESRDETRSRLEKTSLFQVNQSCRFLGRPASNDGLISDQGRAFYWPTGHSTGRFLGNSDGCLPSALPDSVFDINAGLVSDQGRACIADWASWEPFTDSENGCLPPAIQAASITVAKPPRTVKMSHRPERSKNLE